MALRVCSAYCTVSTDSNLVLAGLPPLHLLAEERARLFRYGRTTTAAEKATEEQQEQQEWDISTNGQWTRRLIRNIMTWIHRKWGKLNYHLTQCFTGHGTFGNYLK
ncbi:uncharacterized protein LOC126740167 [Anthonomus grandis grandis]|uniref:uncharacterized protein LOC126740167 n=1 Tax=Anthonomus grandis grandis TaxID=2921223 RepID=UPI002165075E|nr:uncharacterized protein LOC126740167 [Anthonomus grandis grandis]